MEREPQDRGALTDELAASVSTERLRFKVTRIEQPQNPDADNGRQNRKFAKVLSVLASVLRALFSQFEAPGCGPCPGLSSQSEPNEMAPSLPTCGGGLTSETPAAKDQGQVKGPRSRTASSDCFMILKLPVIFLGGSP